MTGYSASREITREEFEAAWVELDHATQTAIELIRSSPLTEICVEAQGIGSVCARLQRTAEKPYSMMINLRMLINASEVMLPAVATVDGPRRQTDTEAHFWTANRLAHKLQQERVIIGRGPTGNPFVVQCMDDGTIVLRRSIASKE